MNAALLAALLTLPITVTDSGTLQVEGTVGGRSALLTLDTGAGTCRLPPSLLPGAAAEESVPSPARPGEPPAFPLVRVGALAIGGAREANFPVASWSLLDEMHLSGVASARLFAATPVTIDLAARRLVFERPESLAARAAAGEAVPLDVRREGAASLLPLAAITVDGARRLVVVDTGYTGALELADPAGTHEVALGAIAKKVRVSSRKGSAGRLGLAFFEGRALTFDLPGSRLIVSR